MKKGQAPIKKTSVEMDMNMQMRSMARMAGPSSQTAGPCWHAANTVHNSGFQGAAERHKTVQVDVALFRLCLRQEGRRVARQSAVGASVDAAPGEGPSPVGAVVEGGAATYYGV